MNGKSKALSSALLTLESAAITAVFSGVNIFVGVIAAWFAYIAMGTAAVIEGVLLHRRSTEYDIQSEPVRVLCTYAPLLLFSSVSYAVIKLDPNRHTAPTFLIFYFWTTIGVAATGLLISSWIWLNAYLEKHRKESKLPKIPYFPNQVNADDFFNDKKE